MALPGSDDEERAARIERGVKEGLGPAAFETLRSDGGAADLDDPFPA
jgi:hypothetical protein